MRTNVISGVGWQLITKMPRLAHSIMRIVVDGARRSRPRKPLKSEIRVSGQDDARIEMALQCFADCHCGVDRLHRESDWTNFSAEGLAIARAVKTELPGWTVFYFDEARACVVPLDGKRRLPSTVEYEILLDDESYD